MHKQVQLLDLGHHCVVKYNMANGPHGAMATLAQPAKPTKDSWLEGSV